MEGKEKKEREKGGKGKKIKNLRGKTRITERRQKICARSKSLKIEVLGKGYIQPKHHVSSLLLLDKNLFPP